MGTRYFGNGIYFKRRPQPPRTRSRKKKKTSTNRPVYDPNAVIYPPANNYWGYGYSNASYIPFYSSSTSDGRMNNPTDRGRSRPYSYVPPSAQTPNYPTDRGRSRPYSYVPPSAQTPNYPTYRGSSRPFYDQNSILYGQGNNNNSPTSGINQSVGLNPAGNGPAWINNGAYQDAQTYAGGWYYPNTGRYVPITWAPSNTDNSNNYYSITDDRKKYLLDQGWSPEELDYLLRTGREPYTKHPYWKHKNKGILTNKGYRRRMPKPKPNDNPKPKPNYSSYNNTYMPMVFWHGVV